MSQYDLKPWELTALGLDNSYSIYVLGLWRKQLTIE